MGPEETKAKAMLFDVMSWILVFAIAVTSTAVQLYWYWQWLAVPLGAQPLPGYGFAFAFGVAARSTLTQTKRAPPSDGKKVLIGALSDAVTSLIASWSMFGLVWAIVGRG